MGNLRSWDFSKMCANDPCGRARRPSLAALVVAIPVLMVLTGMPMAVALAAIDMTAKVDVELVARSGSAQDFVVRDGGVLRSGDGLQLRLASDIQAYVYIIAYGSSHTAVLLHPFSARPADALIRPGQKEVIPEPGVFLPLDGHEGVETLFTIASDAPLKNIADLLARIETHGDDLAAISAMLRSSFPLARRLSFKHIGASPLVGVTATAPRAAASAEKSAPGAGGNAALDAGPSLLPPAAGGWAVSSSKSFAPPAGDSPAPAGADAGRSGDASAAPAVLASVAGEAPAGTSVNTSASPSATDPASDPASAAAAPAASSARQAARAAAGIDEQRFRGILATLPSDGSADAPTATGKPFQEQGVLAAEGSRIRALERAQLQSGSGFPDGDNSTGKDFQN